MFDWLLSFFKPKAKPVNKVKIPIIRPAQPKPSSDDFLTSNYSSGYTSSF